MMTEQFEIRQTAGPRIMSKGEMLCEVEHKRETARLIETEGGNLIVWTIKSDGWHDRDLVQALVIEDRHNAEIQVMDYLGWTSLARKMQRAMKWELVVEVP